MLTASGVVLQVAEHIDGVGDSANLLVRALQRFAFALAHANRPRNLFCEHLRAISRFRPIAIRSRGALGAGLIVRRDTVISRSYEPGDKTFITGSKRGVLQTDTNLAGKRGVQFWQNPSVCLRLRLSGPRKFPAGFCLSRFVLDRMNGGNVAPEPRAGPCPYAPQNREFYVTQAAADPGVMLV
jgi:hypothetical protein